MFDYKVIPVDDVPETDLLQHFEEAHKYMRNAVNGGGKVLVHW